MITLNDEQKDIILDRLRDKWWKEQISVANDVLLGKYGNGEQRKKSLTEKGYDYEVIQTIINFVLLG